MKQLELSQQQFEPIAYILILTVPIFFWLLFRLAHVTHHITLPYYGLHHFRDPIEFWQLILWLMVCSITISQVIRKALNIRGL